MRLFIDTNSFHGYFGEESDTSSLTALEKLLREKKLVLFCTAQVKHEYSRNVADRIDQTRKAIKKISLQLNYVPTVEGDELKKAIEKKVEEAKSAFDAYREKKLKNFEIKAQETDKLILRIIDLSECVDYSPELIERAKLRHIKGNPPKKDKDDSHGDAINWESILEKAVDDDLAIVTRDPDYTEKGAKGQELNRVLRLEWASKTKKSLKHYLVLGTFINAFEEKLVIQKTTIRQETLMPISSILGYQGSIVVDALRQIQLANDARTSAILSISANLPDLSVLNDTFLQGQNALRLYNARMDETGRIFAEVAMMPGITSLSGVLGVMPNTPGIAVKIEPTDPGQVKGVLPEKPEGEK